MIKGTNCDCSILHYMHVGTIRAGGNRALTEAKQHSEHLWGQKSTQGGNRAFTEAVEHSRGQ